MARHFSVEAARRETLGVDNVIHLNNAGASLMPVPVADAIRRHLDLEESIGGYEAAEVAGELAGHTHGAIATLLNCAPTDVALTDSASSAWARGFSSIRLRPGDRLLASSVEYGGNYADVLHSARRAGATVEIIPADGSGIVDVAALRQMLGSRVRALLVTHVPCNGGLVNPIAEIGSIAREAGVLYLVDACQSVGQVPIDVAEIGCDFLAACGRKYLRGPRGTGFLYVRPDCIDRIEPASVGLDGVHWLSTRSFEFDVGARRFELWEANMAARIGLGVAVNYALQWEISRTYVYIKEVAEYARECLGGIEGITLCDRGGERCGLVTFTAEGDMSAIREQMRNYGINIWTCLANSAWVDMQQRGMDRLLRASVHYYNTLEEIDTFCRCLDDILHGRRAPRPDDTARPSALGSSA